MDGRTDRATARSPIGLKKVNLGNCVRKGCLVERGFCDQESEIGHCKNVKNVALTETSTEYSRDGPRQNEVLLQDTIMICLQILIL